MSKYSPEIIRIPLNHSGKGGDYFYVKQKGGLYWLCHEHRGINDDLNHCVPISKEFYQEFLKEKERKCIHLK
jgi:hypothetical protein